jgi:hypothetical protein
MSLAGTPIAYAIGKDKSCLDQIDGLFDDSEISAIGVVITIFCD